MNSKALKDWEDDKQVWYEKLKPIWWFVEEWHWKLLGQYVSYLKKVWAYAQVLRTDYDFDAQCLFAILHLKLTRVKKNLENGHAIQEETHMHALDLAIKLAARLDEGHDYYWRPHTRHDKKWGESEHWFEPVEEGNALSGSYWRSKRAKAVTEEEKEQERKEFLVAAYAEEFLRDRDSRILFGILAKYIRYWWD